MRVNTFTVEGYKNLTAPVTFGPLGSLCALHGPNNIGKSNLLDAIDLFFGLLAVNSQVCADQFVTMDEQEQIDGHPFREIFNGANPAPIRLRAELALSEEELRQAGIEPECPTDPSSIGLELAPVASGAQLRVTQFQLAAIDALRDGSEQASFAETVRAFVSGTYFLASEQTVRPFARLDPFRHRPEDGSPTGLIPQHVRDALFDARQSLDRERRARWSLFQQVMRLLEPELGAGEFDTAFDRASGRADLVFVTGHSATAIDRLGAGVQRLVALLGTLVLARAMVVSLAEPELGLHPDAQERLLRAARAILESPGGPGQLLFTTHSPVLSAGDAAFAMEAGEGAPAVLPRIWEGGLVPLSAEGETSRQPAGGDPSDLDQLIGLVDQLAELEPEKLVVGAPASREG